MSVERTVEITPSAPALIGSLRGLGYSPEAAIADLIDNSITAGARKIAIDVQWNDGSPSVATLDDGHGMDEDHLAEAMRLGGDGPESAREASDLGRFGLGLKTASLSQCRRTTIISKAAATVNALTLDVDVIATKGWIAVVPDENPIHPFVATLLSLRSGTVVFWDHIDELSGLSGLQKEPFYLRLEEIRAHIGMVFHRFLNGDATRLAIAINGRNVKGWDPFQTTHPSTREMPSERIRHGGSSLTVKPYVLPHRDRYASDAEYEAAGGPGGWDARQGFYVYRGKRLLVPGSWLGLGGARTWTRDETSRLARIEVDLPTTMDRDWRIDVRKAQARPPGALRTRLTAIAGRCRQEAREVFAFRGQQPHARGLPGTVPPVWLALQGLPASRYRINPDHPIIRAFRENSDDPRSFDAVLSIIERSVPIERIWLDVSESEGAEVPEFTPDDIEKLSAQLLELGKILPTTLTPDQRADALLSNLTGDITGLRQELLRKMGEQHVEHR